MSANDVVVVVLGCQTTRILALNAHVADDRHNAGAGQTSEPELWESSRWGLAPNFLASIEDG